MKVFGIVVALILVIGGGWLLMNQNSMQEEGATENEGVMEVGGETSEESIEHGMMEEEPGEETSNIPEGTEAVANATFNLTGWNFAFSETEIRVKKGQTVTVNFESTSGFHDWVVDEFNAATKKVNPGEPTSVTFVADKAGTFEYYCSVGSHRANGMVGNLIVEE